MEVNRILLPTDFSNASAKAAACAVDFAKTFDADLHVLFVLENSMGKLPAAILPPPRNVESLIDSSARNELSKLLGVTLNDERRVLLATSQGPVSSQILQYAEKHEIDLIIMGTHGRKGLSHMLMGSDAENVVGGASCPVMTVRGGE